MAKFRSTDWNILMDGFSGTPFGNLVWKQQRYPWRCAADGVFVAPEILNDDNRPVPNPDWVSAGYEIGWLLAADSFESIKIGPPPKPFASGKMSPEIFGPMSWNGEVQLTKNFLIMQAVEGGGTVPMTNDRGRFVKFISSLTFGCLPTNARNCIPVVYQRARPPLQG
jgi:hypothetical protein